MTDNAKKSTLVGSGLVVIYIIALLVNRSVFVKTLGSDMVGVNGILVSLVGLMILVDLGIGTFANMKQGQANQQGGLAGTYQKAHLLITGAILVVGIILSLFFKDALGINSGILLPLILLAVNAFISYIGVRQGSFGANGQTGRLIWNLAIVILQIFLLFMFKSYVIYLLIRTVINLITVGYGIMVARREQQSIDLTGATPSRGYLLEFLSGLVILGTDIILTAFIAGIKVLGLFLNYVMLAQIARAIIVKVSSGRSSQDGDSSHGQFLNFALVGTFAVAFMALLKWFIPFWLGDAYVLPPLTVGLMIGSFILMNYGMTTWHAIAQTGGERKLWLTMAIEFGINVIASIFFAKMLGMGLNGILVGTIIASLVTLLILLPQMLQKGTGHLPASYYTQLARDVLIYALVFGGWYWLELNSTRFASGQMIPRIAGFVVLIILFWFLGMLFYRRNGASAIWHQHGGAGSLVPNDVTGQLQALLPVGLAGLAGGMAGRQGVNGPNMNVNGPNVNGQVNGPNMNVNGPNVDVNAPNVNGHVNGPNVDVNTPNVNGHVNGPNVDVNAPNVNANVNGPNMNVNGPNVDVNAQGAVDQAKKHGVNAAGVATGMAAGAAGAVGVGAAKAKQAAKKTADNVSDQAQKAVNVDYTKPQVGGYNPRANANKSEEQPDIRTKTKKPGFFARLMGKADDAVDGTKHAAQGAVNGTVNGAKHVANGAQGAVNGTVNGAQNMASGVANGAQGAVNGTVNGAQNVAQGVANGAQGAVNGTVNGAQNVAQGVANGAQVNGGQYQVDANGNQINGGQYQVDANGNQINGGQYQVDANGNQINGGQYQVDANGNQVNGGQYQIDANGNQINASQAQGTVSGNQGNGTQYQGNDAQVYVDANGNYYQVDANGNYYQVDANGQAMNGGNMQQGQVGQQTGHAVDEENPILEVNDLRSAAQKALGKINDRSK